MELYTILGRTLEWLDRSPRAAFIVAWMRLRVLVAGGWAPVLDQCASCAAALGESPAISLAVGGALCVRCAAQAHEVIRVDPRVRRTLAEIAVAESPESLIAPDAPYADPIAPSIGREITRLVALMSAWVLDRPLAGDRLTRRRG